MPIQMELLLKNTRLVKLNKKDRAMLQWVVIFLIVAIIAAAFGFTGIAGTATGIAKFIFVIFIVLFLGTLLIHLLRRKP